MSDWQPIESAPKNTPIIVWGYRIQGQAAPGGPYKWYWRTVGKIPDWGECLDLLEPECDCISGRTMPHPLKWMPLPDHPSLTTGKMTAQPENQNTTPS